MTPEPKLLPCPFCGGVANTGTIMDGVVNRCHCPRCQIGFCDETRTGAINAWNTRATPDDVNRLQMEVSHWKTVAHYTAACAGQPPLSAPVAAFARKMQEQLKAVGETREMWRHKHPSDLARFVENNVEVLVGIAPDKNGAMVDDLVECALDIANGAMAIVDACGGLECGEGK